jgi:glycosyltransferase involved in cell wall biosynthesis
VHVLVVHNRYRSSLPSGENRVVDDEVDLLRAGGVRVSTLLRSSDDLVGASRLRRAPYALGPAFGIDAVREMRRRIEVDRPDVVHIHNVFPMISPAVIRVARRAGVPVVQSVHNYRHSCIRSTLHRDGAICEDCVGRRAPWPGVLHGCYRGSRLESTAMAIGLASHRETWKLVDRFLVVSEFVGRYLQTLGVDADRIAVKANAVADPGPQPAPGDSFLFAGRLDAEKGVQLLLDAWRLRASRSGRLVIAGDGDLRHLVDAAAASDATVSAPGAVDAPTVRRLLRESRAVVVPSTWYEGSPRIITEAWAHGRPVLATAVGALPSIVGDDVGWTAKPDPRSLAARLAAIDQRSAELKGAAARRAYLHQSTPEAVFDSLMATYLQLTPASG